MASLRPILLVILILSAQISFAEDERKDFWQFQTSVYTKHFHPNPEHNNHQELIGIDYNLSSGWFFGGATFRNSFRQRSIYGYAGRRFELENTPFYARISGGFIQGYHGKYRHKIPMNGLGIAPAIIPSVGIQIDRFSTEVILLGFNAMMINVGFRL